MKTRNLYYLVIVLLLVGICIFTEQATTFAADTNGSVEETIKTLFSTIGFNVDTISRILETDVPGLYQVVLLNNQVIYISLSGKNIHLIFGQVVRYNPSSETPFEDLAKRLLSEKVASIVPELKKVAIKIGNGPLEVIEIIDPDCPFCRLLHEFWKPYQTDVTRYVVLYPLPIHPQAEQKSIWILMGGNESAKRFEKVMAGEVVPEISQKEVVSSPEYLKAVTSLNLIKEQLRGIIRGTPTLIIKNELMDGFNESYLKQILSNRSGNTNK